jgi:hypothetical protein
MRLGSGACVWQAFLEYRDDILNYLGVVGMSLIETKQIGYVLVRVVQICNTGVMVSEFCGSQP